MLSRRAHATYITRPDGHASPRPSARIALADGHSLSVQASEFTYCRPRCSGRSAYTHFEVGFPTFVPKFLEYAEDPEDPAETIYPYVPAEVICNEINTHGGLTFSERVATFCAVYTNEYFDGECFGEYK